MAHDGQPRIITPAPGIQRPGIPGAGNLLDPAIRDHVREALHDIIMGMVEAVVGRIAGRAGAFGAGEPMAPPQEAQTIPAAGFPGAGHGMAPPTDAAGAAPVGANFQQQEGPYRAGKYPHGDVDLSYIVANVPSVPERPKRGASARTFPFLNQAGGAHPPGDVEPGGAKKG